MKVTQTKNQVVIRLKDMETGWLTKLLSDLGENVFCRDLLGRLLELKLPKYDRTYFGIRKEIRRKYKEQA